MSAADNVFYINAGRLAPPETIDDVDWSDPFVAGLLSKAQRLQSLREEIVKRREAMDTVLGWLQ